ncbi:hypothetical protein IFJ82_09580 [Novacetimonas hansenii]|uniref:hypothetical protein n=1 Tax=Novacetimonas hansenii TaxID=436 RepID=UPI001781A867|nr:hypothetical protein [Novacetimonas hansenii]QOF94202.1 hypothetical protein IFJ82_09580 [Novacetimonas hansenii]
MTFDSTSARQGAKNHLIRSGMEGAESVFRPDQIDWAYVRDLFVQHMADGNGKIAFWACTVTFYDDTWHYLQRPGRDEQAARQMAFRLSSEYDKPVGMYDAERPAGFRKEDVA